VTWVWPVVPARDLPALTADEMRQVDRVMVEDLGIELIQMMENAGLHLAELARSRFSRLRDVPVTVLAGGGNNGGGGLVCARHLANWGAPVSVVLDRSPNEITGVPAHQMRILRRMGLSFLEEPPASSGLIVDALIGYGLSDDPKGLSAELIERANGIDAPTFSLDAPSGLDTTTGSPADPCIQATATLTLALPKRGLLTAEARPVLGRLFLADISVPAVVYSRMGLGRPWLFEEWMLMELELPKGSTA
jgi:NAD(P)H-hydrate epimerase